MKTAPESTLGSRMFRVAAKIGRCMPHFRGKYRVINNIYASVAKNHGGAITATLSKPVPYQMTLNLDCAHERLAYCVNGYEEDTVRFLFKLWDSSGYFLDIGANIGLISVPFTVLAKQKIRGTSRSAPLTVSLEPVTSNFASLRRNVEQNGLQQEIRLFNAGAGAENVAAVAAT